MKKKTVIIVISLAVAVVGVAVASQMLHDKDKVKVEVTDVTEDIDTEEDTKEEETAPVEEEQPAEEKEEEQEIKVQEEPQEVVGTDEEPVEVSDKFSYISENYRQVDDNEEYMVFEDVRQIQLTPEEFCVQGAFDEFLTDIGYDSGNFIEIQCMDEDWKVYHIVYDNIEMDYSYQKNKLTLVKHRLMHD